MRHATHMTPQQFKAHRKALGLTQAEFASLLGFTSGRYIRALESGERAVSFRTQKLLQLLTQKKGT